MPKLNKIFSSRTGRAKAAKQGQAGYDNPRENIDPHIKTQAVSTRELSGSRITGIFYGDGTNLTGTGDNLGNHIATQTISGANIYATGDITTGDNLIISGAEAYIGKQTTSLPYYDDYTEMHVKKGLTMYKTDGGTERIMVVNNPAGSTEFFGNMEVRATGSTIAAPRIIGTTWFTSGTACQVQFGDAGNAWYNSHGGAMQLTSYHTLKLLGDRGSTDQLGADATSNVGVWICNTTAGSPALLVDGAASQTADLTQWKVNGGSTLANVDKDGNITTAGNISGATLTAGNFTGIIVMWSGTIASIPTGWVLCDGTNGTPDLRDRFVVGASSDLSGAAVTAIISSASLSMSGGSITHSHTNYAAGHIHGQNGDFTGMPGTEGPGQANWIGSAETDTATADITIEPESMAQPYYALAYIMKV